MRCAFETRQLRPAHVTQNTQRLIPIGPRALQWEVSWLQQLPPNALRLRKHAGELRDRIEVLKIMRFGAALAHASSRLL